MTFLQCSRLPGPHRVPRRLRRLCRPPLGAGRLRVPRDLTAALTALAGTIRDLKALLFEVSGIPDIQKETQQLQQGIQQAQEQARAQMEAAARAQMEAAAQAPPGAQPPRSPRWT